MFGLLAADTAAVARKNAPVDPSRFIRDGYDYGMGGAGASTGHIRVAPYEGDAGAYLGCMKALSVSHVPEHKRWVWCSGLPFLVDAHDPLPPDDTQDPGCFYPIGKWSEVDVLFVAGVRVR